MADAETCGTCNGFGAFPPEEAAYNMHGMETWPPCPDCNGQGVVQYKGIGLLAEYEDNLPGGFNNPMLPEEIVAEKAKRRKRFLPWRISFWVIILIIAVSLAWLLSN